MRKWLLNHQDAVEKVIDFVAPFWDRMMENMADAFVPPRTGGEAVGNREVIKPLEWVYPKKYGSEEHGIPLGSFCYAHAWGSIPEKNPCPKCGFHIEFKTQK